MEKHSFSDNLYSFRNKTFNNVSFDGKNNNNNNEAESDSLTLPNEF